jgi:5'-3' exonuclease
MAKKAENKGFTVYMVTSDKDYGPFGFDKYLSINLPISKYY